MRNRLIYILLLCATCAAAQIPTLTNAATIKFKQGNTIFDRSVADVLALVGAENVTVTGNWTFSSNLTQLKDAGTYFYDDVTTSKTMRFQLSGISAATTRNLTIPNADGTIALTSNSSGLVDLTTSVTGLLPFANLADGSALSVLGRSSNSSGVMASIAAGSDNQVLRRSGTSIGFGAVNLASSSAVTGDLPFSNITQLAGLSVAGRSANSTGDMAAITGTVQTSPQVQGTTLGFFPIPSKTFFTTATLPTTNLATNEIGVLSHTETGRTALVEIDVLILASGVSCLRKYIFPLVFNSTSGNWVRIAPFFSNGSYGNPGSEQDFELEMKSSGAATSPSWGYDTLRLVRTAGTIAGSAQVVIQYCGFDVDGNGFTATSNTGVSTSPGMYDKQAFSQVKQAIGVNTCNPASALHVVGTGSTSATDALRVENSSGTRQLTVRNDGKTGIGTVTSPAATLNITGAGTTSATTSLLVENSAGTDVLTITDDQMTAIGTATVSTQKLTVRGSTSDNTAKAFVAERSSGTDILGVQNDGKVSINNAAYTEELTINGQAQLDGVIFTNQTSSVTASGHVVYTDDATHGGYLTVGDGDRQLAIMPTMIERHVIDYGVDWTTGRKGAFWTVPARFNGWKISKAYIEVTSVGSGAGDDEITVEIGGVAEGVQIITSGTHTLVMDDVINTDDVITFNVTEVSATAAKGLNVSLELSKN